MNEAFVPNNRPKHITPTHLLHEDLTSYSHCERDTDLDGDILSRGRRETYFVPLFAGSRRR